MKANEVLAKLDEIFTSPAREHTPTLKDRSRKPAGEGDQRTTED